MRGLIDKIKGSGKETPGQEWRRKVLNYASAINAFVDVGLSEGWDAVGKEPETPKTDHLIKKVVSALKSNQNKKDPEFRELWPPAHGPFASSGFLEKYGQGIPAVSLLEDGTILARIGSTYGEGKVVRITDGDVQPVPDVVLFGACPNKRYYAVIRENRNVDILDGWDGPKITGLNWPTGTEGVPTKYNYSRQEPITCERIMAFPNGRNALLIGTDGIYVLGEEKAHRLHPDTKTVEEGFEWRLSEYPEDPLSFDLAMPHGAISRDGKFIAIGSQDSSHLVFNENYEQIADIGNQSEYPHYTLFSQDNTMLAMNSCHFYNGCTIGVKTAILEGLETEPYKDDERVVVLNESARVYAGVSRNGEFIIGDASGYIRAMDETGKLIWQLFLGSSIGDMDISEDGKFLLVSTYAGFLAKYDLDSAEKAPHQIGSGSQRELFRWVFWKGEKPLLW